MSFLLFVLFVLVNVCDSDQSFRLPSFPIFSNDALIRHYGGLYVYSVTSFLPLSTSMSNRLNSEGYLDDCDCRLAHAHSVWPLWRNLWTFHFCILISSKVPIQALHEIVIRSSGSVYVFTHKNAILLSLGSFVKKFFVMFIVRVLAKSGVISRLLFSGVRGWLILFQSFIIFLII